MPKPAEIRQSLDQYVIGQERAKKTLTVAVHNHYKRVLHNQCVAQRRRAFSWTRSRDVEIEKSNILLIGPTGSGKTLLAQTLAQILDVPFCIADATTLTEAGYVGEDVENIILRLLQNADYDVKRAEIGIVYIDEIDKIGRKTDNVSHHARRLRRRRAAGAAEDSRRQHLQRSAAGRPQASAPGIHPGQHGEDSLHLRRRLRRTRQDRAEAHRQEGDGLRQLTRRESVAKSRSRRAKSLRHAEPEDLLSFGMIPEFIGRLPVVTALDALTEDEMVMILTETKNAMIKQYTKLLPMEGVRLSVTKDALRALAQQAATKGTGARALRSMLERIMLDIMYDVPSREDIAEVTINRAVVEGKKPPLIRKKQDKDAA